MLQASTEGKPLIKLEESLCSTYTVTMGGCGSVLEGHLVANDPILQYLMEHRDVEPNKLIVASISKPLRAIYAVVKQVGHGECLLDNGSMIVSMSRKVAEQPGLTWDPNICINMESTSNHLEKTLRLARNIKSTLGGDRKSVV